LFIVGQLLTGRRGAVPRTSPSSLVIEGTMISAPAAVKNGKTEEPTFRTQASLDIA
jgi:hypothetical protein